MNILTLSSGGLDVLFSNQRKLNVALPTQDAKGQTANMDFLIHHLHDHYLTDHRKDFFMLDDTV